MKKINHSKDCFFTFRPAQEKGIYLIEVNMRYKGALQSSTPISEEELESFLDSRDPALLRLTCSIYKKLF